ncbi:hypothetical protein CYMTET_13024 [Cymbomonas tetramitiformis]|uniref:Uncharacterized protein n=1 Tax=Cymbomonas tetramitiformis TaxID=36881 RepID=A0AAE0LBA7_9CHLO|nr:hypothetical protein CYMTET_13024 [Cymbomonas tetramitiformis]
MVASPLSTDRSIEIIDSALPAIKEENFNRYFFPLEDAEARQPGVPFNNHGGTTGSSSELKASPRPFYGHYDVYCDWDQDVPEVDASTYSPNVGFSRLHFTRTGCAVGASATMKYLRERLGTIEDTPAYGEPNWHTFASENVTPVDIEELVQWACHLRPRSIHDMKPLLILLQGLLKDLLGSQVKTYSNKMLSLQELLLERECSWADAKNAVVKVAQGLQAGEHPLGQTPAVTPAGLRLEAELLRFLENFEEEKVAPLRTEAEVQEMINYREHMRMEEARVLKVVVAEQTESIGQLNTMIADLTSQIYELDGTVDDLTLKNASLKSFIQGRYQGVTPQPQEFYPGVQGRYHATPQPQEFIQVCRDVTARNTPAYEFNQERDQAYAQLKSENTGQARAITRVRRPFTLAASVIE